MFARRPPGQASSLRRGTRDVTTGNNHPHSIFEVGERSARIRRQGTTIGNMCSTSRTDGVIAPERCRVPLVAAAEHRAFGGPVDVCCPHHVEMGDSARCWLFTGVIRCPLAAHKARVISSCVRSEWTDRCHKTSSVDVAGRGESLRY